MAGMEGLRWRDQAVLYRVRPGKAGEVCRGAARLYVEGRKHGRRDGAGRGVASTGKSTHV